MPNFSLQKNTQKGFARGFTLIEIMVAIGIFAVVAVVAMGALLKVVDANKKAQSLETSINNLNFIFDSITREMRVGMDYYCTTNPGFVPRSSLPQQECNIASGPWVIAFNSSHRSSSGGVPCPLIYAYAYDGNQHLTKAQQTECSGTFTYYPLLGDAANDAALDSKITFEIASVKVVENATQQPYAQLHFKGTAGVKERTKSAFDLQTTISQRLPN